MTNQITKFLHKPLSSAAVERGRCGDWGLSDPDSHDGEVQAAHRLPAAPPDLHTEGSGGAAALVCRAPYQVMEQSIR